MKKSIKFLTLSAVALTATSLLPSCSMDQPFGDTNEEGALTISTEFRSNTVKHATRALTTEQTEALREKCVVYIENSKGVIRKYRGVDNIPQSIKLKYGDYVCNAWSGDSVSASFDSKFYRGQEKFEIAESQQSLVVKCNIANVIVSVDPSSLDVNLTDLKVTFAHSRGSLEFTNDNIQAGAKGYFMMPNADTDLNYKVEGKKDDGSAYLKEGVIENVQRAHEYIMSITQDESQITEGGALIRLEIMDVPVIDEEVEIFSAPVIRGVDFNIENQVVSLTRNFNDTKVYMLGYFGMSSVIANFSDNFGIAGQQNLLDNSVIASLKDRGIVVERTESKDASASVEGGEVKVDEIYVTFTKAFLDGLADSATEYSVTFEATDGRHKVGTASLRIANNNSAVDVPAPVQTLEAPDAQTAPMAVLATSATLQGKVLTADAVNFGIKYREVGTSEWQVANPAAGASSAARRQVRANMRNSAMTRAEVGAVYEVTLTGLKPGTAYEYKAYSDGFEDAEVVTFTTEAVFAIPNASFEDWSSYSASTLLGTKNVSFPGTGSEPSFWDSGNEGAATANKTLTKQSSDMVHSGSSSARLASDKAMGILAAGNIFTGDYVRTDGTNGVLSFGRPYNGSHPVKVRVYANYRPGTVDIIKSGSEEFIDGLKSGDLDKGQIYCALTTEPVEIRTSTNNRKLFDKDEECVLAYGQVTFDANFGPDGQLESVEIPFEYFDRAKTTPAKCLVIVVSASKYGDYFSGSSSSVMYLDDFELIYE